MWNFPITPENASTFAGKINALMGFMVGLTVFFSVAIAVAILFLAARYHHSRDVNRSEEGEHAYHLWIEIIWTVIPLILVMVIFFWSTGLFYHMRKPPAHAIEIFVTGKQWMWKTQHPTGPSEINALHIPIDTPIKLSMISEDVVHSFSIPAFRVKQDVIPGRYTSQWFEASRLGTYRLFCTQYCGTSHSLMIGAVTVMPQAEYQAWLSGGLAGETLVSKGEKLFTKFACSTCHVGKSGGRGPTLVGLYNAKVALANGRTVTADATYLRESIMESGAKMVAGYDNIMPSFKTQLGETDVQALIAYIKSLKAK